MINSNDVLFGFDEEDFIEQVHHYIPFGVEHAIKGLDKFALIILVQLLANLNECVTVPLS